MKLRRRYGRAVPDQDTHAENPRGRVPALLGRAEPWLAAIAIGTWWRLYTLGKLIPRRTNDTPSYEFPWEVMSFSDILMNARTLGYPLVLEAWDAIAGSQNHLPLFHLLAYCAGAYAFWHGLKSYSQSQWLAFAATVPVLVPDLWPYFRYIQPETLAPAVVLMTIGALLHLVLRPRSRWLWLLTGVAVAVTYHLRPSYVFLGALAPILGCLFMVARGTAWRAVFRLTAGLLLICLLPVFLYSGLRSATVHQFGVANMVGYSLIGISATFLDQETVARLPEEHRRLGDRILFWREKRNWAPYTEESHSPHVFRQYVRTQWSIAAPLAKRLEMQRRERLRKRRGEEALPMTPLEAWYFENRDRMPLAGELARAISDRLQSLAMWLIHDKPHLYRKWVIDAFTYGLREVIHVRSVKWSGILLLPSVLLFLATGGWRQLLQWPRSPTAATIWSLWALALGYFLASLVLIAIVSWPIDRYLQAAALFIAPAMMASTFAIWNAIGRKFVSAVA